MVWLIVAWLVGIMLAYGLMAINPRDDI